MHREHAVLRLHLFLIVTKVVPNVWKGELSSHLGRKYPCKCCDPVLTSYQCSYPFPCPSPPLQIISHPHPSHPGKARQEETNVCEFSRGPVQ